MVNLRFAYLKISFAIGIMFISLTATQSRADAIAIGFCDDVLGSIAPARANDLDTARRKALQSCRAFGGSASCCKIIIELDEEDSDKCIAIAISNDGDWGSGSGPTQLSAASVAMRECVATKAKTCEIKSHICR